MCGFEGTSTGGGVGGLVGSSCGEIEASYATGPVSGTAATGGLAGTGRGLRVRFSYWDLDTSGMRVGVGTDDSNDNGVVDGTESPKIGAKGMTTTELQAPTDYEGIYETWNVDLHSPDFGDGEDRRALGLRDGHRVSGSVQGSEWRGRGELAGIRLPDSCGSSAYGVNG